MQELTYPKYFIFWLDINSPPNKRIEANTKKELIKKLCLFLSYDSDEIFNIQKKSDTGICGYNTDGGWAFCGGRYLRMLVNHDEYKNIIQLAKNGRR